MSHIATNWAFNVRGLKPATKIVLLHLADCHNRHTGQCNPRQATLADMCEMSRSTLNLHLSKLEDLGLITRHDEVDPKTKRQRPTSYTLAIPEPKSGGENGTDMPDQAESENRTRTQDVVVPSPKTGHGAVSENRTDPCPKNSQSRVRISDTIENLGREPGIASEQDARARAPGLDVDRLLFDLYRAVGVDNGPVPAFWLPNAASGHVLSWHRDYGLTHDEIVSTARQSRQQFNDPPRGPKALDRAMSAAAAGKTSRAPSRPTPVQARGKGDARLDAAMRAADRFEASRAAVDRGEDRHPPEPLLPPGRKRSGE